MGVGAKEIEVPNFPIKSLPNKGTGHVGTTKKELRERNTTKNAMVGSDEEGKVVFLPQQ